MLANSQERFQVFAEHDFFARPGIAPSQSLRDGPRRRRTHRIAGMTMLAAAVGTVAGVIAFTWLPGVVHRRRSSPAWTADRVEHADRPAWPDALASRPQRSRVRVVAHTAAPVAQAVVARRPQQGPMRRGSSLRTRTVRRLAVAREDTRTAIGSTEPVAEPQTPTHPVEFGFER